MNKRIILTSLIAFCFTCPAMAVVYHIDPSKADQSQCAQYGAVWNNWWCVFDENACDSAGGRWVNDLNGNYFCDTEALCYNITAPSLNNLQQHGASFRFDGRCFLDGAVEDSSGFEYVEGFTYENCGGYSVADGRSGHSVGINYSTNSEGVLNSAFLSCFVTGLGHGTSSYYGSGGSENNDPDPNSGSGNDNPSGDDPNSGNEPSGSPFRVARTTVTNADGLIIASGAYSKGAYNANVGNINTSLGYVEESSIATINAAKVSANNMNLSVNGFTPSGTVNVNSNSATINGSFNVPTTVAMLDSWGADTTTNGTLGGIQPANITNGSVSGIDATFTGTASGDLSGTGSFSNASVHVDGWVPDNPS